MVEYPHLILIDKDDTLVDARTDALTDSELPELVRACQEKGFLIGLNSDSPLEPLRDIARSIGMRGPVLAEGGALLLTDPDAVGRILIPTSSVALLRRIRPALHKRMDLAKVLLCEGDVVSLRKRGLPRFWPQETRIIAINALRRASFMCFAWTTDAQGELIPDPTTLEVVAGIIKRCILRDNEAFRVHTHPKYGVLTVHAVLTTKAFGVQALRGRMPLASVTMIGDSLYDECGDGVLHVAVANASEEFRARADIVLPQSYTAGVCTFLRSLLK